MPSKRQQQEAAGRWLRDIRKRHGFDTADSFARRLDVSASLLSRYETGISGVPDDKAEKIAEILDMDIIEVRRALGLWTPPPSDPSLDDEEGRVYTIEEIQAMSRPEQIALLEAQLEVKRRAQRQIDADLDAMIRIIRETTPLDDDTKADRE